MPDQIREAYYSPCTESYPSMDNFSARDEWLYSTEPGELPTHQRILAIEAAKTVAESFLISLATAVTANAVYRWTRNTPLPAKNSEIQPLADGPYFNDSVIL